MQTVRKTGLPIVANKNSIEFEGFATTTFNGLRTVLKAPSQLTLLCKELTLVFLLCSSVTTRSIRHTYAGGASVRSRKENEILKAKRHKAALQEGKSSRRATGHAQPEIAHVLTASPGPQHNRTGLAPQPALPGLG